MWGEAACSRPERNGESNLVPRNSGHLEKSTFVRNQIGPKSENFLKQQGWVLGSFKWTFQNLDIISVQAPIYDHPRWVHLVPVEDAEKFINDNDVVVIGFFKDKESSDAKTLLEIANNKPRSGMHEIYRFP